MGAEVEANKQSTYLTVVSSKNREQDSDNDKVTFFNT